MRNIVNLSEKKSELVQFRRHQIVEGASRIFFEKGFHPTTVREIAKACNMSMGQLYRYISSKDDILFMAYDEFYDTWREEVLENPRITELHDPIAELRMTIELTLRFIYKHSKIVQFVFSEAKHLDKKKLRDVVKENKKIVKSWEESIGKVDRSLGITTDVNFAAKFVAHSMNFIVLKGLGQKKISVEKDIELLKGFLLRGLGIADL